MADKPNPLADLQATIAAGPPPSESPETPVGVPKGFKPDQTSPGYVQYVAGDKFKPAGWSIEAIGNLQDQMEGAGLYVPGTEPSRTGHRGWWNPSVDVPAFTDVLTHANGAGQPWTDSLNDLLQMAVTNGPAIKKAKNAAARAQVLTSYTHPDDLRVIANKVSRNVIGRDLSDADMKSFINGYHGMEAAQGDSQRDAAGGTGGGSYNQAPSAEAEAQTFAEQEHPEEAYATKYVSAFNAFDSMINASAPGSRPSGTGGTTGV